MPIPSSRGLVPPLAMAGVLLLAACDRSPGAGTRGGLASAGPASGPTVTTGVDGGDAGSGGAAGGSGTGAAAGSGSSTGAGTGMSTGGSSTTGGTPGTGGGNGGGVGTPVVSTTPVDGKRDRYAFSNACVALKDSSTGKYVVTSGSGYAATATTAKGAEPFTMKPTLLGEYALMNKAGTLLDAAATVDSVAVATATDTASFRLLADGDATAYPATPVYDTPMTAATISTYRGYADPLVRSTVFTLGNAASGQRLTANGASAMTMSAIDAPGQRFVLEDTTGCGTFPEAHDNTVGETFKGTTSDGRVLGLADVHLHTSSSTFLGGALSGRVFHKFGALQAMGDCAAVHGPHGTRDVLAAAYENDTDGHATDGWPTFSEWPQRESLTHRAIYWKWIERAWKAGLRVMVNNLVENATLCELQSKANGKVQDCNEMNEARRQVGTMYALQDYIDAQYGGRGKGFFRIVLSPAEARQQIAQGRLAVVLGMEISNLFNCQINYSPLRQKEPYQEDGSATENRYACAMTETGAANEILTQMKEMKGLGVRELITIHEFDNAFGGNGIFNGAVLNLGTRENSGGIPSGTPSGPFSTSSVETATGEFWTTYDCPEQTTPGFSGYLWGTSGGTTMTDFGPPPPACMYTGQNGRPGGTTACYPAKNQCNARWLTPIGLYTYSKIMEQGLVFDFDHLEMGMKTQVLELTEAQNPVYPLVSTHGTFGGTSHDQATRVLANGGFLYPSLDNVNSFLGNMQETRSLAAPGQLFGFGFGNDTDGLSGEEDPRAKIAAGKEVKYPFTLFAGAPFDQLADFKGLGGVVFNQPEERDGTGAGRTWSQDKDGNAHYGMLSDFVEEMRQEGSAQDMQALYNSAERYLRTWEQTEAAAAGIAKAGGVKVPKGILRAAPKPSDNLKTAPFK